MDERRKKAFDECLRLWKELSERLDIYTIKNVSEFKQDILTNLGIGERREGCPFCDLYYNTDECPLGDCSGIRNAPCHSTPYHQWNRHMIGSGIHKHCQEHAIKFYNYLKDLATKEGYEIWYDNDEL